MFLFVPVSFPFFLHRRMALTTFRIYQQSRAIHFSHRSRPPTPPPSSFIRKQQFERVPSPIVCQSQEYWEEIVCRTSSPYQHLRNRRQSIVHKNGTWTANVRCNIFSGQRENAGQKSIGAAAIGCNQRRRTPFGRGDKGDFKDMAIDNGPAMGRITENVHIGLWRLRRSILFGADNRGRTNRTIDCRLYWYYIEEEAKQRSFRHWRWWRINDGGRERCPIQVSIWARARTQKSKKRKNIPKVRWLNFKLCFLLPFLC